MPVYNEQSGDLDRCHGSLTHSMTLRDSATQLLIKYKSLAFVTQKHSKCLHLHCHRMKLYKRKIAEKITPQGKISRNWRSGRLRQLSPLSVPRQAQGG